MNPSRLVFCMDIGGTRTKYGLVDLAERAITAQIVLPTVTSGAAEFVLDAKGAVIALCEQAGISKTAIKAGGVGVPGYTDGDLVSQIWESLSFMEGVSFRPALETGLGFPLRTDNDARLVALGEAHFGGHTGSGKDHSKPRRLLSLTLGTGLGVALVVDGQLQEKSSIHHLAGHIPIRPGAAECFCGFSGCLEILVGAPALVRNYRAVAVTTHIDAREIFRLASTRDEQAVQAVRQLCADLVTGLNAYIFLYGPDAIVLGGGMANGLRDWLPLIREGLFATPYVGYQVNVVVSTLGEQAGLYGAASLWDP